MYVALVNNILRQNFSLLGQLSQRATTDRTIRR